MNALGAGCLATVLLSTACSRENVQVGAPTVESIVAVWKTDREAALKGLHSLDKQADVLIALDALLVLDTAWLVERCDQVPTGPPRERCGRIASRAHLWESEKADPSQPVASVHRLRESPGPAGYMFPPRVQPTSVGAFPRQQLDCELPAQNHTCVTRAARRLARNGKWQRAAAACGLLSEQGAWGKECFFNAAEALVHKKGPVAYPEAAELCLHASRFKAQCLQHAIRSVSLWSPRSSDRSGDRWKATLEAAEGIRATWEGRDDYFAGLEVDRYGSSSLLVSYLHSDPITGDPLDFVPEEWERHVRAAAAWRLVELEGDQERSLDAWVTRLEQVLTDRVESSTASPEKEALFHLKFDNTWTRDAPGDGVIPATFFLGRARRPMSMNPSEDAAICILESAFRQGVQVKQLLADAGAHPSDLVRWTGMHLVRDQADGKRREKGGKGKKSRRNPG